MNRKGSEVFDVASKSIYWMIASIIIVVVVLLFAALIAGYQEKLTAFPPELRAELISLRFIHNPDCFAYQDPDSERVITGSIDLNKFTPQRLDSCYITDPVNGRKELNFNLQLESGMAVPIHTNKFFNADSFIIKQAVFVYVNDSIVPDTLRIYVQVEV